MSAENLSSEPSSNRPHVAGVVLCGGKSSRMGQAKAMLPFGSETMLQRVIRILEPVASPIAIVAAEGQTLPSIEGTFVARDSKAEQGPLQWLRDGLSCLATESSAQAAFATSCDVPFLNPHVVRFLAEQLTNDVDVVIPKEDKFFHPLCAIYRVSLVDTIEQLIASGVRRHVALLDHANARIVDIEQLRSLDPKLDSFMNLNHPEDYQKALARLAAKD